MAKILVTNDFVPREKIALDNANVGAVVGQALVRAGENQKQAADRLLANSKQEIAKIQAASAAHADFEAKAKRARNNSLANNTYATAMQEYVLKANDRMSQKVDDNGNPTFEKLPEDLMKLGVELSNKYGRNLDPEAAPLFNQAWAGFIADRLPNVLEESRRQQLDFSKASLSKTLDTIQSNAQVDKFANFHLYERQVKDVLANAIADGTLPATEAVNLQNKFRGEVALGNANKLIFEDPAKAIEVIKSSSPADLGLTGGEYSQVYMAAHQQFVADTKAKAVEAKRLESEKQAAQRTKSADYNAKTAAGVKSAILDLEAGRIDSLGDIQTQLVKDPNVDPTTKLELDNIIKEASDRHLKQSAGVSTVMEMTSQGIPLVGVGEADISKAFLAQAKSMPDATIMDLGRLAMQYKGKSVQPMVDMISTHVMAGNDQEVMAAVQTADMIMHSDNPEAIGNMPQDAKRMIEYLSTKMKVGISDPKQAIADAKRVLFQMDKEAVKQLKVEAYDVSDKVAIDAVRRAAGGANAVPILNMFVPDAPIPLEMQLDIEQAFRQKYVELGGDKEAAASAVALEVKKNYGRTSVSKASSESPMRFPPEKIAVGVPPEALRADLESTISDGTSVDDVVLENYYMDDLGPKYPKGSKVYVLYKMINGVKTPILNPKTGVQDKWLVPATGGNQ